MVLPPKNYSTFLLILLATQAKYPQALTQYSTKAANLRPQSQLLNYLFIQYKCISTRQKDNLVIAQYLCIALAGIFSIITVKHYEQRGFS